MHTTEPTVEPSTGIARGDVEVDSMIEGMRRDKIGAALFGGVPTPQRIGRFEVHGVLGQGGMGTVLDAYDPDLDRRVALKLLRYESGVDHQQRLLREAKALARLSHPNVVQVYDVGTVGKRLFIAMELVHGETLARWQSEARDWRECLLVYAQAGAGLVAAHARGLVHRDFKPANCIREQSGRVCVLDFGLVREATANETGEFASSLAGTGSDSERSGPSGTTHMLTRTGAVLGTLAYMAPEQLLGQPADASSDQFGFCVALYEALHGHRPFAGRSPAELLHAIQERRVVAGRVPAVPMAIDRILLRGLAVSQHDRWPSMAALLAALARVPKARRRKRISAASLVGLALAGVGVAVWPSPGACDGLRELEAPAWTQVRRAEVEHALLEHGGERGQAVWNAVERGLDRYSLAWIEARAEACEATHVERTAGPQTLELRFACLDRRMDRMSALVDQLALADASVVARAAAAVDALPSIDSCLDAEALLAVRSEVSPELRPRELETRATIDEAWALHQAGRSQPGADQAELAVLQAERLGAELPQLRADARFVRGTIALAARRIDPARADLHAALAEAEQARDQALAGEILRALVSLETWSGSTSTAQAWLIMARARGSATARDEAELAIADGLLALEDGHTDAATERLDVAVGLLRNIEPVPELALARALRLRGEAELDAGEAVAARASLGEALSIAREQAAPLVVAQTLHDLALAERELEQLDAARQHFETALALQSEVFGADAPISIHLHLGLVELLLAQGDIAGAEREAAAARAIFDREPSLEPYSQGLFFMMLARLNLEDDPAAALDDYVRARAAFAAMPEPDQGAIAMADSGRASCEATLGRRDEARQLYEQALARLEAHVEPDHPRWLYPLCGLGSLLVELGDYAAAVPLLERALELDAAMTQPPDAELRWQLGRALHDSGSDPVAGLELVLAARAAMTDPAMAEQREQIDAWLHDRGLP